MAYSYKSIVDGGADSDLVYYNASIVATNARDTSSLDNPPVVRFNESRDAPIVKNAQAYEFSIVRFSMNGPNKNLPLFIPIIQTNGFAFPVQNNPNRTIYYVTIPYQRAWAYTDNTGANQTRIFTIAPESTPIIYRPETQNTSAAPVPNVPLTGITKQDLSTRYYWVYTYRHWCDLVNEAMLSAMNLTYTAFLGEWTTDPTIATPFPYPTFADFLADNDVPFIKYNEDTKLFSIFGDTRAFNVATQLAGIADPITGKPLGTNVPVPDFSVPVVPAPPLAAAVPQSAPYCRLFFNSNLYGLFTNFKNTYFNVGANQTLLFPLTGATPIVVPTTGTAITPTLYTNEILFTNEEYTNILNNNPLLQGFNAVPPPAYNPYFLIPASKQHLYWNIKQDYPSTGSLWSPVSAIVFQSSLLPLKKEFSAKPLDLGQTNNGISTGGPAAFEPTISDFIIDQQYEKAEGWRDFTIYEPTAEYRMVSMNASHDEVRNIDISVFWKYRLTGELYPLTMFNCSDVNIKMLFRRTDYHK